MNEPMQFQQYVQLRRYAPEFPGGGAVFANPGLLPQGTEIYEDGSYVYPWKKPGAEWARTVGLPGLFGAGPNAVFVPKGQ